MFNFEVGVVKIMICFRCFSKGTTVWSEGEAKDDYWKWIKEF